MPHNPNVQVMHCASLPPTARANCKQLLLIILSFACMLLVTSPLRAQTASGAIEGTVYNYTNDLPIAKAVVSIKGTLMETLTDESGRFRFTGVPAGEVLLQVVYLGFDSQSRTLTLSAGQTATSDFQLVAEGQTRAPSRGGVGDEVVVLEKFRVVADQTMTAQAIAMNEQRHAASISHVLALDELPGQGYENIGDYIRFLPGVSIVDDGESAGYLAMGGFPASMSTVMLDGGGLATAGVDSFLGGGRELSLQEVPMMNIERVEVTKVPTPDKPASGLGGSMNLVSKGLLGTRRARLDYTLTMNLATNDDFSLSGENRQASIPGISGSHKQPSFSLRAVVPASKNLVFSAGYSRTWKQLPPGALTETATWNLWDGVSFNNALPGGSNAVIWGAGGWPVRYAGDTESYDPNAPTGTYPGVTKGNYPIALNGASWSFTSLLTETEDIQAGMEIRLSARDTLAVAFRHREVNEARSALIFNITYGSGNTNNPAWHPTIPAGADPATTTGNAGTTGSIGQGGNSGFNYNLDTKTDHLSLRYKHKGPKWNIDADGSYSRAARMRTNRGRGYVSGYQTTSLTGLRMTGEGINTTDSILPVVSTATKSDGTVIDPFNSDELYLNLVRMEEWGRFVTENYEGRVNVERIFNRHLTVKAGGMFTREERDNQRELPIWRMLSGSTGHPLSDVYTTDPRSINLYDLNDSSIVSKIGGVPISWTSPVRIYQLTQNHPDYFQPYSASADEVYSVRASNSKLLREDIIAGYLRTDIRLFSNRLHAVIGARFERTEVNGWSGLTDNNAKWVRNADGNRVRDEITGNYLSYPPGEELYLRTYKVRGLHLKKSYDGLYPSVNINFAVTPNFVARAAYARTIGRPNVNDIVSGVSVPDLDDFEAGTNIYRISISNPGLEPWTADSYHLSLDSYHLKGGFGSIGVYRKNISNFFARRTMNGTEADLREVGISEADIAAMLAQGSVEFSRTMNIGDADLTGIEFSYRQDLFFLPSWLQKMQIWANYTHIKVSGPNAEEFTGFTPDTFSGGINYIRSRFSLRLSVAYQGETKLRETGRTTTSSRGAWLVPPGTYEYQAPRTRWGVTAEYAISPVFTLFANCNDIFADDIITTRRAADTPSYAEKYQRRVVASYVSIGVKGTF